MLKLIIIVLFGFNLNNLVLNAQIPDESQLYKDDRVATWNFGSPIRPANKSVEFDLRFDDLNLFIILFIYNLV